MTEKDLLKALGQVDEKYIEEASPSARGTSAAGQKRSYLGLKRAVLIAAATVATICCLFMLNANVRAAVLDVFRGTDSHGWTVISFGDPGEKNGFDLAKVSVNYVPDGLTLPEEEAITFEYGKDRVPYRRDFNLTVDESAGYGVTDRDVYVSIGISRTENWSMKFNGEKGEKLEDYYTPTTVRGMFAFKVARFWGDMEYGSLIFGDRNVTVEIFYEGITMDEAEKIAEGIIWQEGRTE